MKLIEIFQGLIPLIAPLLVFTAALYYLVRVRNLDSIFLSLGSGMGVLMSALFTYMPYYAQTRAVSMTNMSTYYAIGGFLSLAGTVVFTIGLFMLIDRVVKQRVQNNAEKNPYQF